MNTLAARYPKLLLNLPFLTLAELPTPLDRADNLAAELGLDTVWIKRDDLSGMLYGGNKVRKLEYLFADALAQNCDSVMTFGAVGSNHVLATSLYAKQLGLECYGILTEQPKTQYTGDTLRWHLLNGTHLVPVHGWQETLDTADRIEREHGTGEHKTYRITWGGSSWRGTVGFVNAAFELADQLTHAQAPDKIYVACGTMGTAVGLALGLRLAQLPTVVEAIRVVPGRTVTEEHLCRLFDETIRKLNAIDDEIPLLEDPMANLNFRSEFLGDGYAERTPECVGAVELMGKTEGHRLETTYTGKGLAALIDDARSGRLKGQQVAFWNTYNSRPYPPALADVDTNALPDELRRYLG
jgi:1-aminocyclopropane-1-carboxylate deaminase/D-cysteine desulfhydrase-like pyridoxal-dependent ACC family enzyme